mgnify:CR=1 FL=1
MYASIIDDPLSSTEDCMPLIERFIAKLRSLVGDRSDVFPHSDEASQREMDVEQVADLAGSTDPMGPEEWSGLVDEHAKFLESGGTGGEWQLLSVSGLPMCIYTGAEGRRGEQAVLRLKNIAGVDGSGRWLCWADLSGAYARGADFSGANLSGSVLIDSWFEEASFEGAQMQHFDRPLPFDGEVSIEPR